MRRTLLCLALLFATAAHADRLRLAFNTLEPWKVFDGQHRATGAYTEIARELARRLGMELEIVECPLKRCLFLLERGQADLAIGLQTSPEREHYLRFLATPYRRYSSDKVFYLRQGEGGRLTHYESLYGLKVGLRLGSELFDRFDLDTHVHKEPVPDQATNFRKLLAGRIDAVLLPEDQGEYLVATLGLAGKVEKASYREVDGSPRSIALAKHSPMNGRLADFEAAMAAMRRDGTLTGLYQRYYYRQYGVADSAVKLD
jgi:polar amino acid transport system substrate-binding protein